MLSCYHYEILSWKSIKRKCYSDSFYFNYENYTMSRNVFLLRGVFYDKQLSFGNVNKGDTKS